MHVCSCRGLGLIFLCRFRANGWSWRWGELVFFRVTDSRTWSARVSHTLMDNSQCAVCEYPNTLSGRACNVSATLSALTLAVLDNTAQTKSTEQTEPKNHSLRIFLDSIGEHEHLVATEWKWTGQWHCNSFSIFFRQFFTVALAEQAALPLSIFVADTGAGIVPNLQFARWDTRDFGSLPPKSRVFDPVGCRRRRDYQLYSTTTTRRN